MKKLVLVSLKTFAFFVGWAICVSILPIPDTKSAAVWRFWAELIPLLSVIGFTIIFWLIDKRNIRLHLTGKPVYNIVLGCITGAIWLGVSVVILSLTGVIHINGRNQISMLWLWLFSAFINSVMQEVLVRGYLYQMIKNNYNIVVAVLISTGLFTFAHGGAFEAGILPVLNVYNDESFRDGSFGIHGILSCSDRNPFFMEWSWCNYFGWSIVSRRLSTFVQHGN